jgi:hypothetical protein
MIFLFCFGTVFACTQPYISVEQWETSWLIGKPESEQIKIIKQENNKTQAILLALPEEPIDTTPKNAPVGYKSRKYAIRVLQSWKGKLPRYVYYSQSKSYVCPYSSKISAGIKTLLYATIIDKNRIEITTAITPQNRFFNLFLDILGKPLQTYS